MDCQQTIAALLEVCGQLAAIVQAQSELLGQLEAVGMEEETAAALALLDEAGGVGMIQ